MGWKLGSTSCRPLAGIVHRHWAEFCDLKDGEVLISELTTINYFMCHTKIHKNITVGIHSIMYLTTIWNKSVFTCSFGINCHVETGKHEKGEKHHLAIPASKNLHAG